VCESEGCESVEVRGRVRRKRWKKVEERGEEGGVKCTNV